MPVCMYLLGFKAMDHHVLMSLVISHKQAATHACDLLGIITRILVFYPVFHYYKKKMPWP